MYFDILQFSEKAQWVGCFEKFVQANYRHKKVSKIFHIQDVDFITLCRGKLCLI